MKCPFCNSKTKIYNSRGTHDSTQTWRRHRCTACKRTFTTREKIDWTGIVRVRTQESKEAYNRERLLLSLVRASEELHLPSGALTDLTDTIELQLQQSRFFTSPTQEATVITEVATTVLQRYSPHLALQYVNNVYRNQAPLSLLKRLVGP